MIVPFLIPTTNIWAPQLLYVLPTFGGVSLFHFSNPSVGVIVFHSGFNMHFSNDIEHLFQVIINIYISSFVIYLPVFWFLTVFKNYMLLLTYRISLHVPETSPLPNIFFVNIFLQSLVCLFIFLMTHFGEHIFNFDEVYQIPVISFYSYSCLWCGKEPVVIPTSWDTILYLLDIL